jgi:hypothetical protein
LRIAVLNNLRAGRAGPQLARVLELLRRRPEIDHVETRSARDLPGALRQLERTGIDLLVVNGGDGTLQYVLSALLADPRRQQLPAIAPLRGGRTNMTAADLGADRNPVRGLTRVLEAVDGGYIDRLVVERPVLRVRSSHRAADQYGMFFGAGLIHRAIGVVHRSFPPGRSQGLFGASVVTGALIAKMLFRPTRGILTPDKCSVQIDGRELLDAELYLLIASSLERLFLRLDPFWGERRRGVRLTAIESRAPQLARAALPVMTGRARPWMTPEAGYTSLEVPQARIRMNCGFTVDGELFDPEPEEEIELRADDRITFLRA